MEKQLEKNLYFSNSKRHQISHMNDFTHATPKPASCADIVVLVVMMRRV